MTLVYDPLGPGVQVDPYPLLAELRDHDPVHWSEALRGWVLTRFDDVNAALKDERLSADRFGPYLNRLPPETRAAMHAVESLTLWLPFIDPPDHTRLRALVNKAFTPRSIERLRPRVRDVVDELLDRVDGRDGMDVVVDLAYPLPATVIAEMIGVPAADRDRFKAWSSDLAQFVGGALGAAGRLASAQAGLEALSAYIRGLIAERRRAPADDLMTALIAAEEHGDALSEAELVATCVALLFAGHETTANLIGNGLLALLRHPEQLARLRAEPALIPAAVEEMLRYDGPVQAFGRVALVDLAIDGRTIRAGQRVFIMLSAADRDPAHFADPDRFEIGRTDNHHIAFGFGIHYCLGAPLARLEAQIAFQVLLERLPHLRLAGEPEWNDTFLLRGLRSLPVAF